MEEIAKKILFADDDNNFIDYGKSALIDAGFLVDTASDGDEALEKIINHKYELVLLDLLMPVKTGIEVLQELRDKTDKTPVIALASSSDNDERQQVLSLGAAGYYVKSGMDYDELVDIVNGFFSTYEPRQSNHR